VLFRSAEHFHSYLGHGRSIGFIFNCVNQTIWQSYRIIISIANILVQLIQACWSLSRISILSNLDRNKIFFFPQNPRDLLWGPPHLLLTVQRSSFPEVKRPVRGVDHSPPSLTKVKTDWSLTSTPLYAFIARTATTVPLSFTFTSNQIKLSRFISFTCIIYHLLSSLQSLSLLCILCRKLVLCQPVLTVMPYPQIKWHGNMMETAEMWLRFTSINQALNACPWCSHQRLAVLKCSLWLKCIGNRKLSLCH